ncbi:MAG: hypothetical protein HOK55_03555, partial [Gammaproteobacteria bacterium]|nr:hypothetical protein [Gammaproteobacteria bacterium]
MHKTFFSGLWNGLFKATGLLFSLLALAASFAVMPLQAQTGEYVAPRLPGTQLPDFNGIFQILNTANWDIRPHAAQPSALPELLGALHAVPAGPGVIEGGEIPYQDWA